MIQVLEDTNSNRPVPSSGTVLPQAPPSKPTTASESETESETDLDDLPKGSSSRSAPLLSPPRAPSSPLLEPSSPPRASSSSHATSKTHEIAPLPTIPRPAVQMYPTRRRISLSPLTSPGPGSPTVQVAATSTVKRGRGGVTGGRRRGIKRRKY